LPGSLTQSDKIRPVFGNELFHVTGCVPRIEKWKERCLFALEPAACFGCLHGFIGGGIGIDLLGEIVETPGFFDGAC